MSNDTPRPDEAPEPPVGADELLLSAELDGELTQDELHTLEDALASDPELARVRAELRQVDQALDLWSVPAPSPDFADGVVAALPSTGRVVRVNWLPWATAAALLVGTGVFVWQSGLDDRMPTDAVEAAEMLSDAELEAIAEDLDVLANLDALTLADEAELIRLTDDLDLLDDLGPTDPIALEDLPDNG